MDESLQELENELKALRPLRPASALEERIERELRPPAPAARPQFATATSLTSWKWIGWRLAASAALVALVGYGVSRMTAPKPPLPAPGAELVQSLPASPGERTVQPASADVYRPVRASTVLYDLQDEGTVYLDDRQPARQARFRYVDTVTWTNPQSRASLRMSVPRDEVRVLPAKLN